MLFCVSGAIQWCRQMPVESWSIDFQSRFILGLGAVPALATLVMTVMEGIEEGPIVALDSHAIRRAVGDRRYFRWGHYYETLSH